MEVHQVLHCIDFISKPLALVTLSHQQERPLLNMHIIKVFQRGYY